MVEDTWTEENSALYRELAKIAVPSRAEQMATLIALFPFGRAEAFRIVDLGAGEGALTEAALACFPNATALALDGSEQMRDEGRRRFARFGGRGDVGAFDLHAEDWRGAMAGAGVVMSSLCIHHFDGPQKRTFFSDAAARISPRGALLIADIVEPQRDEANRLFAETYDRAAEAASVDLTGDAALFGRLVEEEWNIFSFPDPGFDKPSPLSHQLEWLRDAGFAVADCFLMKAGHAVFGGYASSEPAGGDGVTYGEALAAVEAALAG